MERIIIVFTDCDRVEDEITPQAMAKEWITLLNNKVKKKIDNENIVLFGKKTGEKYDHNIFIPSFENALNEIPNVAKLGMKATIDKQTVMKMKIWLRNWQKNN